MQSKDILEKGFYYHIYNRGINGENIFIEEKNYYYFLKLFSKYITSVAEIYCYCLLKNHFHFLIRINDEIPENIKEIYHPFSNCFNSYSQAINKSYNRKDSLLSKRFERNRITDEKYLKQVVAYIHLNPVKHNFIDDFRKYKYSSYNSILSNKPSKLEREKVIEWFDDIENFKSWHSEKVLSYGSLIENIEEKDN